MKIFDRNGSNGKVQEVQAREWEEEKKDLVQKIRIENEDIVKRKEMNNFLFGNFVCEIPVVKLDRLLDNPLPSSFATPSECITNRMVSYASSFIFSCLIETLTSLVSLLQETEYQSNN